MNRLFDAYRAVHEQAFLPIFVHDAFDTRMQVEACVAAGVKAIEYTLRRPDAREMIPWIRKEYPDLYLLVGSTVDSERIVRKMRRKHPQLMTVEELADIGVDGFVSMLGWCLEGIAKYAPTHLVIPSAQTATEAFLQVDAGAHMVKINGNLLDLVRTCRMPPTFDYCPIFVTGGMTPERIPEAMEAGAVMVASGFDVMLKGLPVDVGVAGMAEAISTYLDAAWRAREACWPEMAKAIGTDRQTWLDALPHYHPW